MATVLRWLLLATLLLGKISYADPGTDELEKAFYKKPPNPNYLDGWTYWVGYRKKEAVPEKTRDVKAYMISRVRKMVTEMRADTRTKVLDEKPETMTGLAVDKTIYFHSSIRRTTTPTGAEEEIDKKTQMVLEESTPKKQNGGTVEAKHCKQGNCGEVMAVDFWFRDTKGDIDRLKASKKVIISFMQRFMISGGKESNPVVMSPCDGLGNSPEKMAWLESGKKKSIKLWGCLEFLMTLKFEADEICFRHGGPGYVVTGSQYREDARRGNETLARAKNKALAKELAKSKSQVSGQLAVYEPSGGGESSQTHNTKGPRRQVRYRS